MKKNLEDKTKFFDHHEYRTINRVCRRKKAIINLLDSRRGIIPGFQSEDYKLYDKLY